VVAANGSQNVELRRVKIAASNMQMSTTYEGTTNTSDEARTADPRRNAITTDYVCVHAEFEAVHDLWDGQQHCPEVCRSTYVNRTTRSVTVTEMAGRALRSKKQLDCEGLNESEIHELPTHVFR
jgi:hypothetical protein